MPKIARRILATSALGSNSEVGGRNREVRFTPESKLNSGIAPCLKRADSCKSRFAEGVKNSEGRRRGFRVEI